MDVEREAASLRREGGAWGDGAVPAEELAVRLLGPGAVRDLEIHVAPAAIVRLHGRWQIWVSPALSPPLRRFAVLHEVAEWHLRRIDYRGSDVEQRANEIAAAIAAPAGDFLRRLARAGIDLERLAAPFGVTQTCAALRLAETTDTPIMVVTPKGVRAARRWPLGTRGIRLPITDQPSRFAMMATA